MIVSRMVVDEERIITRLEWVITNFFFAFKVNGSDIEVIKDRKMKKS